MTAAAVSFVGYIVAGFVRSWVIALPVGIIMMVVVLLAIRGMEKRGGR